MSRNQKRPATRNKKHQPKHKLHLLRHTPRCAPYHASAWSASPSPSYQPILAGRDDKWM